jgi:hypothetical protein
MSDVEEGALQSTRKASPDVLAVTALVPSALASHFLARQTVHGGRLAHCDNGHAHG